MNFGIDWYALVSEVSVPQYFIIFGYPSSKKLMTTNDKCTVKAWINVQTKGRLHWKLLYLAENRKEFWDR